MSGFDAADYLDGPETIAAYLNEAFATNDSHSWLTRPIPSSSAEAHNFVLATDQKA